MVEVLVRWILGLDVHGSCPTTIAGVCPVDPLAVEHAEQIAELVKLLVKTGGESAEMGVLKIALEAMKTAEPEPSLALVAVIRLFRVRQIVIAATEGASLDEPTLERVLCRAVRWMQWPIQGAGEDKASPVVTQGRRVVDLLQFVAGNGQHELLGRVAEKCAGVIASYLFIPESRLSASVALPYGNLFFLPLVMKTRSQWL